MATYGHTGCGDSNTFFLLHACAVSHELAAEFTPVRSGLGGAIPGAIGVRSGCDPGAILVRFTAPAWVRSSDPPPLAVWPACALQPMHTAPLRARRNYFSSQWISPQRSLRKTRRDLTGSV